eukprot:Gb_19999 [translate_table: standard]
MRVVVCASGIAPGPFIQVGGGFNSQRKIQGTCSGISVSVRKGFEGNAGRTTVGIRNNNFSEADCGKRKAEHSKMIEEEPNEGDGKKSGLELPAHVNRISSVANPFVKHLVKLRQSTSYRHSVGSVVVVGTTPLRVGYECQCLLGLCSRIL